MELKFFRDFLET